jgi:rSAM/selenodomain-associated transferase 2
MLVSIIIPVLNEAALLATSIDTIRRTQQGNYDIVVVDGGSTDGTLEVAHACADKVVCAARGRAIQMNAGAAQAAGEVLLFLHVDTQLPVNALTYLQQPAMRWGRFDVRFTDARFIFRVIAGMMNVRSRLTSVATGDQAIFVARDTFAAVGGFPGIALMEDVAISKRLRKLSPPLCVRVTVMTSARRWQQHGIIRTILLMWRMRLLYALGVAPDRLERMYR